MRPLPRGIRNNNPGNLNYAGQAGAHKEPEPHGRFAVFPTAQDGLRALRDQLLRYVERDRVNTIAGIIAKWAPPTDGNDTSAYAATVAARVGIGVQQRFNALTPDQLTALMHAIIRVENGQDPYGTLVDRVAHEAVRPSPTMT
ncbi:structural protein P5 [Saccharibacter floricola]|uniref:structural protein P5 n=1 Tax=Saccharibacter floricola TaxID=231053 RepID=UPI00039EFE45|nr:structural protein P5 [Saccharibacter floricola]